MRISSIIENLPDKTTKYWSSPNNPTVPGPVISASILTIENKPLIKPKPRLETTRNMDYIVRNMTCFSKSQLPYHVLEINSPEKTKTNKILETVAWSLRI